MANRDLKDEWLKEHRSLQWLRSCAAARPNSSSRRNKSKPKGLAASSPKAQRRYLAKRYYKMMRND